MAIVDVEEVENSWYDVARHVDLGIVEVLQMSVLIEWAVIGRVTRHAV
jgi:hypothetical protein